MTNIKRIIFWSLIYAAACVFFVTYDFWQTARLVDAKIAPIEAKNLKGFSTYDTITEKDVVEAKKMGAKALRVMLMDGDLVQVNSAGKSPSEYRIDNKKIQNLKQILKYTQKNGMILIIDLHEQPGLVRWSGKTDDRIWYTTKEGAEYRKLTIRIWHRLAYEFKSEPSNTVIFELMNEPEPKYVNIDSRENKAYIWERLQDDLIKEIRNIDKTHYIIASPAYSWRVDSLNSYKPSKTVLKDKKIFLAVHMYHPHAYTMQWDSWYGGKTYLSYPGLIGRTLWNKGQIETTLDPINKITKKYPQLSVVVTEFSVMRTAPGASLWLDDTITTLEKMNAGWIYHTFKEEEYFCSRGRSYTDSLWELDRDPDSRRIVIENHMKLIPTPRLQAKDTSIKIK